MWILNVWFNASTWNFLSLVIVSIFNVSVLGFSMYFCLKNNKDLLYSYDSTNTDFLIVHLNIRSIMNKSDDFKAYLDSLKNEFSVIG